jgi:hypothetical protein
MKKRIIVVTVLAVPLLTYACTPGESITPTPDVQATVDARVAQAATETAIAQAQAELVAEQTAVAATQAALATSPTSPPVSPTSTSTSTPSPSPSAVEVTQTSTSTPTPLPTTLATVEGEGACPFYVYEGSRSDMNHYVPEGWMGDSTDIVFDDNFQRDYDSSRPSVIQITYTPTGPEQWAGIYWWDPPGSNWGNIDGGFDLSCATTLTFSARGEMGGEKAEFKVGGLKGDFQDSLQPALSTGTIVLTKTWEEYTLDLSGRDLSHVIGGFVWVTNKPSNPNGATIYLDDIRFE